MKRSSGQVALVVLIISAISLTLGLALSDRVRTNVKVDKDDELLQRAFNAAESGIDRYLSDDTQLAYTAPDGSTAEIDPIPLDGQTIEFGEYTRRDGYAFFWLVDHNDDGTINYGSYYGGNSVSICFDDFNGGFMVYYYGMDVGTYGVIRRAYNLVSGANTIMNATTVSGGTNCSGYALTSSFPLGTDFNIPLLLVIKPIGGGSRFAVTGNNFPVQGELIRATGRSADTSTNVAVVRRYDPTYYMSFMLDGVVANDVVESDSSSVPTGVPTNTPTPTAIPTSSAPVNCNNGIDPPWVCDPGCDCGLFFDQCSCP